MNPAIEQHFRHASLEVALVLLAKNPVPESNDAMNDLAFLAARIAKAIIRKENYILDEVKAKGD
ncbi:MAG TPA: hypothetical protein VN653_10880 [Anaerolineales bacterium]|nr:hypothetical protein [Anaerolineales bacterium]